MTVTTHELTEAELQSFKLKVVMRFNGHGANGKSNTSMSRIMHMMLYKPEKFKVVG